MIGQWAHRGSGKSHLVESEVADRFVMHCGREMAAVSPRGRLVIGDPTWSNPACAQCNGHEPQTLNTRSDFP